MGGRGPPETVGLENGCVNAHLLHQKHQTFGNALRAQAKGWVTHVPQQKGGRVWQMRMHVTQQGLQCLPLHTEGEGRTILGSSFSSLLQRLCFQGNYPRSGDKFECLKGQRLLLNTMHWMQIVYFDLPLSLLQAVAHGSCPQNTTKFLRLTVAGRSVKGLDFMASEDRKPLGQVLGGVLDLLEEEVKDKASNESSTE